jgi:hypothetical protein
MESKSIVSAEEVLENTPDFSNGKGKVFFKKEHVLAAMEEYASQFKESQPTDGYIGDRIKKEMGGYQSYNHPARKVTEC